MSSRDRLPNFCYFYKTSVRCRRLFGGVTLYTCENKKSKKQEEALALALAFPTHSCRQISDYNVCCFWWVKYSPCIPCHPQIKEYIAWLRIQLIITPSTDHGREINPIQSTSNEDIFLDATQFASSSSSSPLVFCTSRPALVCTPTNVCISSDDDSAGVMQPDQTICYLTEISLARHSLLRESEREIDGMTLKNKFTNSPNE